MQTDDQPSPAQNWLKSNLTVTNVTIAVTFIVSIVSLQRANDAKNEMQDYRIQAVERQANQSMDTFARRDIIDQSLLSIKEKLETLDKKVDSIGRAVR
jgi:hypothetical protein